MAMSNWINNEYPGDYMSDTMRRRIDTPPDQAAKVSPQEPDLLVPWSEIEATCKRIMKESDELVNDSADYRIGQWSGAEKVLFALDCAAERIRLTSSETQPTGWIPRAERLPDGGTYVLLTNGEWTSTGYFSGKSFSIDIQHESDPGLTPTHWMPIPEAPK